MKKRIAPSRSTMITASVVTAVAVGLVPAGSAFAADVTVAPASVLAAADITPSAVLAGTPWETTGAVDQDGDEVALTDDAVADFVGWAYYRTDGTFTMYNLDDTPKMQGDWSVSADGAERTLVAKDAAGEVLFERTVPITELSAEEFTYRVIPDEAEPSVFYDIIHTPTDHPEPVTEQLAETGANGPIAAAVAGVIALLAGAAVYATRVVRRRRAGRAA